MGRNNKSKPKGKSTPSSSNNKQTQPAAIVRKREDAQVLDKAIAANKVAAASASWRSPIAWIIFFISFLGLIPALFAAVRFVARMIIDIAWFIIYRASMTAWFLITFGVNAALGWSWWMGKKMVKGVKKTCKGIQTFSTAVDKTITSSVYYAVGIVTTISTSSIDKQITSSVNHAVDYMTLASNIFVDGVWCIENFLNSIPNYVFRGVKAMISPLYRRIATVFANTSLKYTSALHSGVEYTHGVLDHIIAEKEHPTYPSITGNILSRNFQRGRAYLHRNKTDLVHYLLTSVRASRWINRCFKLAYASLAVGFIGLQGTVVYHSAWANKLTTGVYPSMLQQQLREATSAMSAASSAMDQLLGWTSNNNTVHMRGWSNTGYKSDKHENTYGVLSNFSLEGARAYTSADQSLRALGADQDQLDGSGYYEEMIDLHNSLDQHWSYMPVSRSSVNDIASALDIVIGHYEGQLDLFHFTLSDAHRGLVDVKQHEIYFEDISSDMGDRSIRRFFTNFLGKTKYYTILERGTLYRDLRIAQYYTDLFGSKIPQAITPVADVLVEVLERLIDVRAALL